MLLVFILIAPSASATSHTGEERDKGVTVLSSSRMRCLQPFSAMQSLGAMQKIRDPCSFGGYLRVESALLELRCGSGTSSTATTAGEEASAGGEETAIDVKEEEEVVVGSVRHGAESCRVTVSVKATVLEGAAATLRERVGTAGDYFFRGNAADAAPAAGEEAVVRALAPSGALTDDDDPWRFDFRLKGAGEIHYKGYGGNGYSVCCDLVDDTEDSGSCVWVGNATNGTAVREVRRCPLPLPVEDKTSALAAGSTGAFHGSVEKPLYKLVDGEWKAIVELWRHRQVYVADTAGRAGANASTQAPDDDDDRESLGRVVLSFLVDTKDIRDRVRAAATDAARATASTEQQQQQRRGHQDENVGAMTVVDSAPGTAGSEAEL